MIFLHLFWTYIFSKLKLNWRKYHVLLEFPHTVSPSGIIPSTDVKYSLVQMFMTSTIYDAFSNQGTPTPQVLITLFFPISSFSVTILSISQFSALNGILAEVWVTGQVAPNSVQILIYEKIPNNKILTVILMFLMLSSYWNRIMIMNLLLLWSKLSLHQMYIHYFSMCLKELCIHQDILWGRADYIIISLLALYRYLKCDWWCLFIIGCLYFHEKV